MHIRSWDNAAIPNGIGVRKEVWTWTPAEVKVQKKAMFARAAVKLEEQYGKQYKHHKTLQQLAELTDYAAVNEGC